jgi:hypothetical protein
VKARRIADHVYLDDLPMGDREAAYPEQPTARSHHESDLPVHERRLREPSPGSSVESV